MLPFLYNHVCVESYALYLPERIVSSVEIEQNFSSFYERLKLPYGTLERLSGIKERRLFPENERPSQIATKVGQMAIDRMGIDKSELKALFNCSVNRDYFEPATAVIAHHNLGFAEDAIAMDITNACIGFSDGMLMLANMIEQGIVKAGLIVTGENISKITDATCKLIKENPDIEKAEFLQLMATFTLGSAGAAIVLAHDSIATTNHRFVAAASRTASVHHELCVGNGDFYFNQLAGLNPIMHTKSRELVSNAAQVGARTWEDLSSALGWTNDDIDNIFCHQIGKVLNEGFFTTMNLPYQKEHPVYSTYGNMISAAMPAAWFTAADAGQIKEGSKNILTAFGSGLNAIFSAVIW